MLGNYTAIPVLPTSDLKRARAFYEDTLGLVPHTVEHEGVLYTTGEDLLLVCPSAFAGTNRATAVAFQIPPDKFDDEVEQLRAAGIMLDDFEFGDAVQEDGVTKYGQEMGVWFQDPDGNYIAVETHRLQRGDT